MSAFADEAVDKAVNEPTGESGDEPAGEPLGPSGSPTLASYLADGSLRVSADVELADNPEPVLGSFTVDGLTYAVTGEGEVMLVAVAPSTLAGSLAGGSVGAEGAARGIGSGWPSSSPRSAAEQVPSGAQPLPAPSAEASGSDGGEAAAGGPDGMGLARIAGSAVAALLADGAPAPDAAGNGADGLAASGGGSAGPGSDGASELAMLSLPDSVAFGGTDYVLTALGPCALAGCSTDVVVLPISVVSIDQTAFEGCPASSVEVDAGNPHFSSYDGMLFDADQIRLLLVPEGKQGAARIPKATEEVDPTLLSHSGGVSAVSVEAGSAAYVSRNGCLYDASGQVLLWAPGASAGNQGPDAAASAGLVAAAESDEPMVRVEAAGGTLEVRALHASSGGFSNDAVFDRTLSLGSWASLSFELPSMHASTTTKSGYGGMWLLGPFTVTMLDGSETFLDDGAWLLEWQAKRKGYTHITWSIGGSGPGNMPLADYAQIGEEAIWSNWGEPYSATLKDPSGHLYSSRLEGDKWIPNEGEQGVSELVVRWDAKSWMSIYTEIEKGTALTSIGDDHFGANADNDEMSFLGWRTSKGEVVDAYLTALTPGEEYTAIYGKPYKAQLDANGGYFDVYSTFAAEPDCLLESGVTSYPVRWDDRGDNAFLHWGNEAWLHYRTADGIRGVKALRSGYVFDGWRKINGADAGSKPEKLVRGGSYQATWFPIRYSIRYLDRAGNVRASDSARYDTPASFPLRGAPDWASGGYVAKGWAQAPEQGRVTHGFGQMVTNLTDEHGVNVDFYLIEEAERYSISYDPAGGALASGTSSSYTVEDADFALPVPTRYGYQFEGWAVEGASGVGAATSGGVTTVRKGTYGDLSCTAQWTLRYDLDVPVCDPGGVTFEADSLTGDVRVAAGSSATGEVRSWMAEPVVLESLSCEGLDGSGAPDTTGASLELEAIFGAGSAAKVAFTAEVGAGASARSVALRVGDAASLAPLAIPAATSATTAGSLPVTYGLELDPGLTIPPVRPAAPVARLIYTVTLP